MNIWEAACFFKCNAYGPKQDTNRVGQNSAYTPYTPVYLESYLGLFLLKLHEIICMS